LIERIWSVGRLGLMTAGTRCRSASKVPNQNALLRLMGPPAEPPKSCRMLLPLACAKNERAANALFS
jgi:hypothetical protein